MQIVELSLTERKQISLALFIFKATISDFSFLLSCLCSMLIASRILMERNEEENNVVKFFRFSRFWFS